MGGNKVRKLEFLLADCLEQGCDTTITLGGMQSNHARATACASRQLGLDPHLILRNETQADPGLGGNLLLSRMVGALAARPAAAPSSACPLCARTLARPLCERRCLVVVPRPSWVARCGATWRGVCLCCLRRPCRRPMTTGGCCGPRRRARRSIR